MGEPQEPGRPHRVFSEYRIGVTGDHPPAHRQGARGLSERVTPVVNSGRHELQPHAAGC